VLRELELHSMEMLPQLPYEKHSCLRTTLKLKNKGMKRLSVCVSKLVKRETRISQCLVVCVGERVI